MKNLDITKEKANFECKSCVLSKVTKQQFSQRSELVSKPFERIHLDLIGPIKPESSLKHRFILTVVDNHSGYLAGFPLVHKNNTTDFFRGKHIQRLICEMYHLEHNGRAEGANQTIVESIRATFNSSGIHKQSWQEILKACCLGLNQIPQKGQSTSPWEIMHGKPFPIDILKAIGTTAVVLNMMRVKGCKFDPKGEEGKLIGFNVSL
ncbi:hypothetical protein VP01_4883g1 [Puccinia sorghi]|uniref:Integrase catalytic domain-containing protein n=1 Tax=Puccinia sorghi TaxID=27349 RepID=A0A0L6UM87_9BASI|nr:hypothetical protein VP01_4883g1 [Puccinia sorghi]